MSRVNKMSFCSSFRVQSRYTLRLALPMIMGQLGQLFLSIVDTIMVGRVGVEALAGVSFGGGIILFFLIIGMGLCSGVHVFVAHSKAASRNEHTAEVLKHGVWIVLAYTVPLALLIQFGINFLDYFGQPKEVLVHAKPYAIFMAWAIVPALVFRCFRNYSEARHFPWPPFWATLLAIILNVFFNWILIFGNCGFPAMGAAGAGLGTLLASSISMTTLVIYVLRSSIFQIHWTIRSFFHLQKHLFWKMSNIGVYTLTQIAFEYGFFTMSTIMMGWLGAVELAAQQVATSYTSFLFMVPLSMAFATTIRVGKSVSEEKYLTARHIGFGSMCLGAFFMAICAAFTFTFRHAIPHLFVVDESVIHLVAQLLLMAAIFQIWDGVQTVAMGALRGIPDMNIPLIIAIVCYWIIGIPVGYLCGFILGFGAIGIWIGMITGIALAAVFLTWRFNWVSRLTPNTSNLD